MTISYLVYQGPYKKKLKHQQFWYALPAVQPWPSSKQQRACEMLIMANALPTHWVSPAPHSCQLVTIYIIIV